MPGAGQIERLLFGRRQLRIGLRIFQFPIAFHQLETELKVAGFNRLPGPIENGQPIGPNEQQRIRFGIATFARLRIQPDNMLAPGAQYRRQRIPRSDRRAKIIHRKSNAFGLKDKLVFDALNINRSSIRAVRAFVGNNRVRMRVLGIRIAERRHRLLRIVDELMKPGNLAFGLLTIVVMLFF